MAKGIDYGHGHTNIDHATGIRYGVIHAHSLNPEAKADYEPREQFTIRRANVMQYEA